MRIAIINVPAQKGTVSPCVSALQKGFNAMGHHSDVMDAWTDDGFRLPSYDYIVVSAQTLSFFSRKFPDCLSRILAATTGVSGKKSAAFLSKKCFFTNKALASLMSIMEKEGMFVNWSDTLLSAEQAEALAKRIGA
jgi:menaquinone-dependent protoporphyrinogen IX oxidase